MYPVWLFDFIPGQHTNSGRLFRSFTICILICMLKRNGYILRLYLFCVYLFSPRTYTLIIQTYELDIRRGKGRREYRCTSQTCVREWRGVAKIDKISILWVFLELWGLQNFSCLSEPTINTCKTISGHTSSID